MATAGKIKTPPVSRRTEEPRDTFNFIGRSLNRKEDPRFLAGKGKFIDDLSFPSMAHAAVLRSPYAHARILSIDTKAASLLPGVLTVITGTDAAEMAGPLPCFANPPVEQRCIALDRVRHVGEPVALVVAENRYVAEDAVNLIEVEFEELPVISDMREAINATGDAVLHPERGSNNVAEHREYSFGPVNELFAAAKKIIRRDLRWPRSGGQPLETAGAVALFDPGEEKFTIHVNSSMYNYVGFTIAGTLGVQPHKVNIVPVDAGGSFGSKLFLHKVPVLAAIAAKATGCPVKYLEDRLDNLTACDHHGSDRIYEVELALVSTAE